MRLKLLTILLLFSFNTYSQCGPGTPSFIADLSASASAVWTSPSVVRNDNCCGTTNPDRCIKFTITLHPDAVGINFKIVDGAVPPGALYYQINCGPQIPVGQPICLSGVGPHILTFCKPGNNQNIYEIESIPPAVGGTNVTINDGCIGTISATGFNTSTIVWKSIFPGAPGAYNNYLSCATACTNPTVTPTGTPPAYVDYQVCGQPAAVCTFSSVCDTVRVTFNPTLGVTINPQNPTICFGQTSTTLTANGTGGTPPYSYLWNSVNPSQSINVGVGTYTVRLSDNSGCPPAYATVTVTSFSVTITANAGPDQTICSQNNPVVTLNGTVTGASGGIWSGGAGIYSPDNTTLTNLNYTPTPAEITSGSVTLYLTTTGNGSCPGDIDTMVINFSNFNATLSTTTTNVSCYGGSDGTATLNPTGGASPFTYSWNTVPIQTTVTATNLSQGTYTVTVTDALGCTKQTSVIIAQPLPLALNPSITNVSCAGGSNGSVSVTTSGGTTPYTYLWTPGNQATSTNSSLTAGTYTVTVTDSKACQLTAAYTVTQPLPLVITTAKTDVSCFSGTNGTITTTVSGGTSPYTYNWVPLNATSPNLSGLSAGTYSLTITDSKGCTAVSAVTITQPVVLAVNTSGTNETCNYLNNGTATLTASGGTPGYTYLWQPGAKTTGSISGLSSGTYSVSVTDTRGCSTIGFVTITEPPPLVITFTNQVNVSCFGGSDGSITGIPSGGTPNYTYSWTPGGTSAATKTGLSAGTYTLTVTDNNGCQTLNTVTIIQPLLPLSVSPAITHVSCNGGGDGSISVTASGGTSPYTYLWSAGFQTTSTASNLSAGTYTVTVTDSKNCQLTAAYTVTQPLPVVISTTPTNVSCFNGTSGSITTTVTGGTSPYTYNWAPVSVTTPGLSGLSAGTYMVTVTDSKGCTAISSVTITQPTIVAVSTTSTNETCNYLNNGTATLSSSGGTPGYTYLWQPGAKTTSSISGLSSGTYTVTVNDANGCPAVGSVTITEPLPLAITFTNQVNVSCFGGSDGSVTGAPLGGTPNYMYSWAPVITTAATKTILSAGTYTLTVTDNNGCQTVNTVTITQPLLPVSISVSSTPTSCYGGTNGAVSATASGGTGAFTYNWMPGNTGGQTVSGLSAGTYTVTATDANGCIQTNSVTVTQPAQIGLITGTVNSNCGLSTGSASVTASGGAGSYTYLWSPGGETNATAPNLSAGAYSMIVTDAAGCTATVVVNVNDNSGPVATIFSTTNVTCNGGSDGTATGGVSGGVPPLTYIWSPIGGTGITATGLSAGYYTFTVLDSNGCKSLATTAPGITEPPIIVVTITTSNVSCFGGNNGTALVTASGGTPGFTYQWLPGGTTGSTISGLSANTYTVIATDSKSCPQSQIFTISQPATPLSVAASSSPVSCFGGANGSVSASASGSGGTGPYNYDWMPGNFNGQSISNLSAGTYTVTATDNNGCTSVNSVTITEPTPIVLGTGSINSDCSLANGQASVSASGGTGSYTYQWTPNGGTNATATGLFSGTYTVTVIDANACTAIASVIVNDNASPIATVSSVTNITCYGGSNGTATVIVSGGAAPFTYSWMPLGGTGTTATGLTAGTYTVIVTDANGCSSLPAVSPVITQPTLISINVTSSNASCSGSSNGTTSATAAGGTPGYSYLWLPSGTTGPSISGLSANTYTVQVTDVNSCVQTQTFMINQPAPLVSVISSSSNVSCFGGSNGSATVSSNGGTPFYSYSWSPVGVNGPTASGLSAGTYTVNTTDFNGCTASVSVVITQPAQVLSATTTGSSTSCAGGSNGTAGVTPAGGTPGYFYQWSPSGGTDQTASGLSPGTYFVSVTDANGCQTNVTITIAQPTAVTGTLIPADPSCGLSNGSISSQVSGGTSPYTYLWQPGTSTTSGISGIGPGTYTLQVRDALNCPIILTATLTNIAGPAVSVLSKTDVSCFGGNDGTATINISQGTAPFVINWSPYGGSGLTATSLAIGTYTCTVTDALGCTSFVSVTITQPMPVSLSISSATNISCNGGNDGTISVSATGGTGTYTYTWSPNNSSLATAGNLSAGTYIVNVKDQNNCPASISISITQPTTLTSSIGTVVNPTCYSNTNGSAYVSATGGTVPYSYLWTTTPAQSGNTAINLGEGSYTVTITDNKGCTTTSTVSITQPLQVITTAGMNDTICYGQTATLTTTATGGSGNYYYVWQPSGAINSGTLTPAPLSNTTYTVTAYDQKGCPGTSDTITAIVYHLTGASIQAMGISPICPGQSTTIYVQTTGNTGPLTYSWNYNLGNGPGAYQVSPTQPTTYIVTVSNGCGVTVSDSVQILFNPPPTVILTSDTTSTCVPSTLQFYDNSVTGNVNDPITAWYWTFGDGTSSTQQDPNHVFTLPGTYTVILTITTAGGCTNNNSSSPLIVNAYPFPVAAFSINKTSFDLPYDKLVCTNQSVGAVTYEWFFGDGGTSTLTNPTYLYNSVGKYQIMLIAKNQFGCPDTAYRDVITKADVVFPNVFTPNPNGPNGGFYNITALDNDIFFPYTSGVTEFRFEIFNRWGELIFETFDIKQGWDGYYRGALCQQDVYVWKAFVKLNNGVIFNKTGDVTLLR